MTSALGQWVWSLDIVDVISESVLFGSFIHTFCSIFIFHFIYDYYSQSLLSHTQNIGMIMQKLFNNSSRNA